MVRHQPSRAALLGAASAASLVGYDLLRAFVDAAQGADPGDISTLNAAAELERAGIKAYQDAAATGLLSPGVIVVAKGFIADHAAHRDALLAAVSAAGGTPSTATATLTYPPLTSQKDILEFALTVEKKAAGTYISVIPDLHDAKLSALLAAILGVESSHVGMLAAVLQHDRAYPTAFAS